ncbi:MAG: hypothetical protein OHK0029_07490 [Armatimonadaceae bacterium]
MKKNYVNGVFAGVMLALSAITMPVNMANAVELQKEKPAMSAMQNDPSLKPKKDAVLVTTGKFKRVTHNTKGTATIYENTDGTRELHITDFSTEAGPALRVYLVAAGDARDNTSVKKAGYLDLGALKKRNGHLVLSVPKGIDLWKYRAVTIWCDKFDVNFGTAPLAAKQ